MALTKAEIETHNGAYQQLVSNARAAQQAGSLSEAVSIAASSLDHIDGMIQYQRKYNDAELVSLDGISIILETAPLLFDFASLEGSKVSSNRNDESPSTRSMIRWKELARRGG